jgi:hypothetical protein
MVAAAARLVAVEALSPYSSTLLTRWRPEHIHAIILLLEEEQASTAALEAEVTTAALQLVPTNASSSSAPPPPSGGDTTITTMLHVQACMVHNIRFLVSTVLDPASTGYARWRDQVLLTQKWYELADHVLFDTPPVNDPAWNHMETSSSPRS